MASARQPEETYEKPGGGGRRPLPPPPLELAATALVGGFDVAVGVIAYALAKAAIDGPAGDLVGAIAFGFGFVFIVVGRSELFTENFLNPVAGLERKKLGSWLKLGELWLVALVVNIVGGVVVALIATSEGVLPEGADKPLVDLSNHI